MKYYVVGGEFLDAAHQHLKPGTREQYGPYDSYEDALPKWRERAWATIDDFYVVFTVLPEEQAAGWGASG